MALLAGGRETERPMIGRSRAHVVVDVASDTVGGQALKPPDCGILMARIALDKRVCSEQRKSILVVAYRFHRCRPALNVVALLTLGAILAPMDICVAISAFVSNVCEDRAGMTLRTRDTLVHAAQWKPRFSVLKLRHISDRLPTGECVTVLTSNRQRTVWASRTFHRTRLLLWCGVRLLRREYSGKEHQCRGCDQRGCQSICKRRSQFFRPFLLGSTTNCF